MLSFEKAFEDARRARLLIAITFHFDRSRLHYLAEVVRGLFGFLVESMDIIVITNETRTEEVAKITAACALQAPGKKLNVMVVGPLPDPFLLTWIHKYLIDEDFLAADSAYTHFIYLEDDLALSFENLCYFLAARPRLYEHGLIPSFLRVEYSDRLGCWVHTDNAQPETLRDATSLRINGVTFTNMTNPYSAFFILDREMAVEHRAAPSFQMRESTTLTKWDIRERAAMGLCFDKVPPGFTSRYVVPVLDGHAPAWCLVHHLPNNYANSTDPRFGKLPINQLFSAEER